MHRISTALEFCVLVLALSIIDGVTFVKTLSRLSFSFLIFKMRGFKQTNPNVCAICPEPKTISGKTYHLEKSKRRLWNSGANTCPKADSCHASIPKSRLLRLACVLCRERAGGGGGGVGSWYPRQEDDSSTEQNTWRAIWTLLTWPPHHVRDSLSVHLDFNAQIVSYTLASLLLKSGQAFRTSEYSCPRGDIKCPSSWDRRASLQGASVFVVCDFYCSQW